MLQRFKEWLKESNRESYAWLYAPYVTIVVSDENTGSVQLLKEGKWITGRFERNIRIDRNTHMRSGAMHGHVLDQQRNLIGIVTQDGKPSHGSEPVKLHQKDADALRGQGFIVPANNIIECVWLEKAHFLLS